MHLIRIVKKQKMLSIWYGPHAANYVAMDNGNTAGTFTIKPNQLDIRSHIANAAFMTMPENSGKGIGTFMAR